MTAASSASTACTQSSSRRSLTNHQQPAQSPSSFDNGDGGGGDDDAKKILGDWLVNSIEGSDLSMLTALLEQSSDDGSFTYMFAHGHAIQCVCAGVFRKKAWRVI